MHSDADIHNQLSRTLASLASQEAAIRKAVARQVPPHIELTEQMVYAAQYPNGQFMMTDIITARAQCLSAMANLKAAQKNGRK